MTFIISFAVENTSHPYTSADAVVPSTKPYAQNISGSAMWVSGNAAVNFHATCHFAYSFSLTLPPSKSLIRITVAWAKPSTTITLPPTSAPARPLHVRYIIFSATVETQNHIYSNTYWQTNSLCHSHANSSYHFHLVLHHHPKTTSHRNQPIHGRHLLSTSRSSHVPEAPW